MDILKISLGIFLSIMGVCIYKSEMKRNKGKVTETMNLLKKTSAFCFSISILYATLLGIIAHLRNIDENIVGTILFQVGLISTFAVIITTLLLLSTVFNVTKETDKEKEAESDKRH